MRADFRGAVSQVSRVLALERHRDLVRLRILLWQLVDDNSNNNSHILTKGQHKMNYDIDV
jgi:hypothetical protein